MIHFPAPGLYVIKTSNASTLSKRVITQWAMAKQFEEFKGCIWLTGERADDVEELLLPYLHGRKRRMRGLEVISTRALNKKSVAETDVRGLCKSLDTIVILYPTLMITENLNLWLDYEQDDLREANPMRQLEMFQRWARLQRTSVIFPVDQELPPWSAFADGLISQFGDDTNTSWWPSEFGRSCYLWNTPETVDESTPQQVLEFDRAMNLGALAKAIYEHRFTSSENPVIHVIASRQKLTPIQATLLLRLGADHIVRDQAVWETQFATVREKMHWNVGLNNHENLQADLFAQDLHEVLTPGQLVLCSSKRFCANGIMVLEQAEKWGIYCTLTRFSLLNHMTASSAARMLNPLESRASCLATTDAIYLFKIWGQPPTEEMLEKWLNASFNESNSSLFSGYAHNTTHEDIVVLLRELYQDREVITQADLNEVDPIEQIRLTDLWGLQELQKGQRPWLKNMSKLLGIDSDILKAPEDHSEDFR